MPNIFQCKTKLGHYAALDLNQFDRHISSPKHSGTQQTSVFEIKAAIELPEEIGGSATEAGREIHVKKVGELNGKTYYTLVIVQPFNEMYSEIVTAYNVIRYNLGGQLWPTATGTS